MGFELSRLLPLIGAVAYWFMKHARSSHALIYRAVTEAGISAFRRKGNHFSGRGHIAVPLLPRHRSCFTQLVHGATVG
jgi:hypothetical protein